MVDAGLIVMTAFISPFRAERRDGRLLAEGEFLEVHVDTPRSRDVKGPVPQGAARRLKNFTGIDAPYEVPRPRRCASTRWSWSPTTRPTR